MTVPKTYEIIDLDEVTGAAPREEGEDQKRYCKFIVLEACDTVYLVFGSIHEFPYHANLVEAFCTRREIACFWRHKPDYVEITDSATEIRGGGWLELNAATQTLRIGGRSTAYGRFDEKLIKAILKGNHALAALQATIR